MDSYYENALYGLFGIRKDKRYRMGLIQGFCSCGKMTNKEFDILHGQIKAGKENPRIMPWAAGEGE